MLKHQTPETLRDLAAMIRAGSNSDLAFERAFNTSSVHDDHMDRFGATRAFSTDLGAVVKIAEDLARSMKHDVFYAVASFYEEGVTANMKKVTLSFDAFPKTNDYQHVETTTKHPATAVMIALCQVYAQYLESK